MKIALYLICIVSLLACSKYTTPRKVTKRLTVGTWVITEFIDNESSILQDYPNISLTFSQAGRVQSNSESSVSGSWELGSDKNPAILYLTFPEVDNMHVLSDDWVVYKLSKIECILKRKMSEEDFDYDSSLDRLTLIKK